LLWSAAAITLRSWKALAGELEAVEEKAGAVGIELVGGEPLDDLIERDVERSTVAREGDGEAAAGVTSDGGFAVGVVEVAVSLAAECG
jgi:hypothetical protein